MLIGVVGEVGDGDGGKEYFIWTRKKLEIGYNGNQVHMKYISLAYLS